MTPNWGRTVVDVVDGWLFSMPDKLPATMLVPLENPHLYDGTAMHELLGTPVATNGVVDIHHHGGHTVGVARPVLGATATAMLVDAAVRRGVRGLVGVGFCGGTDVSVNCGDVLVASAAEAKDGVSTAYDPSATMAYADADLLARVGRRALVGPVCSVAAVHLEDQDLVNRCMAAGVLGLDLEVASFYTVARLREAAAIAILTVSDVPARGACADGPLLGKGARLALELAVSLALEMEQAR